MARVRKRCTSSETALEDQQGEDGRKIGRAEVHINSKVGQELLHLSIYLSQQKICSSAQLLRRRDNSSVTLLSCEFATHLTQCNLKEVHFGFTYWCPNYKLFIFY